MFAVVTCAYVGGALGIAAGCGDLSTSVTVFVEGGPAPPPPPPPVPGAPPPPPPPGACDNPVPIDPRTLPYEPPAAPRAACSVADLSALEMGAKVGNTPEQTKPLLGAPCAACVYTDATNATWGPIVLLSPDTILKVNVGGCYALVTGSAACGKALQLSRDCSLAECVDCIDNASYTHCATIACGEETTAYGTECAAVDPAMFAAAQAACEPSDEVYDFDGPVRVMCMAGRDAGADGDAGSDAGVDADADADGG